VEQVETLKPLQPVSPAIINLYLLDEWYSAKNVSPCYFLDLFATTNSQPPKPEDIDHYLTHKLFQNPDEPPPVKPVVLLLSHNEIWFTVCFDYQTHRAYVFGSDPSVTVSGWSVGTTSWDPWVGRLYWIKVSKFFSSIQDHQMTVTIFNYHFAHVSFVFLLFQLLD
jgi:hypothetical protein